ncbi:radical SAM protein [Lacrimispora algidixylanolytica]|uniref:Radical SAM protein n=1 Tax=Lacrimispora algidixylanolytica TaxID=94868 RepID=A0A419T7C2_9FIRM|nr:radical SAM protein [Lacrimispora algidixylanolytica]RKD33371.1 radical SAM protein [Lacrimispora algidixylanolytica]
MNYDLMYQSCNLCPRNCNVDRSVVTGYCGCLNTIKAARAALHHWEEPCISGTKGSGTVFFTGCTLRCCFCQNHSISQEGLGKEVSIKELSQIFLRLQDQGAHNINLVTATQYLPSILPALDLVKGKLSIPVVYNCGGYETLHTVKALEGYVDIWLPDLKYESSELSMRYSGAKDYFQVAKKAIKQMILQTGSPQFDSQGSIMKKGVIIRHMVLPGAKDDSIRLLHFMKEELPEGMYYISLMSQYTPFFHSKDFQEINRRITTYEYNKVLDEAIRLGLDSGFMQEKSSAKEEYTPHFDLEGIL